MEKKGADIQPKQEYYCAQSDTGYEIPVATDLWLRTDFADSIWQEIVDSPLLPSRGYRYSDLGFYLISKMVHRLSGKHLDVFLDESFFCPMGLQTKGFNPLHRVLPERIAPTEYDAYFRMQKIQGYVHDMGAAMWGGVSGHAGLFSNAEDLAAVMQMLLQKGYYGGQRFLKAETVETFLTRHPESTRRGMGFDMRQMDSRMYQNVSSRMSAEAFGHDGFTGTSAWADPETGTVFILLSNRTYPTQRNPKLNGMRIRQRMQSVVYQAVQGRPESEDWVLEKLDAETEFAGSGDK
jgi:CubicO group peptidase (beta-lactamase class C family)